MTNKDYQRCVQAGACKHPSVTGTEWCQRYDAPGCADYPVSYVSWQNAVTYCQWAGKRLPTTLEWEKAARGPNGYVYPWGDDEPGGGHANLCDTNCAQAWRDSGINDGFAGPAPVGFFPAGASPYGVLDMAGNVAEWVDGGSFGRRIARGGSYKDEYYSLRASATDDALPGSEDCAPFIGFRCARDED